MKYVDKWTVTTFPLCFQYALKRFSGISCHSSLLKIILVHMSLGYVCMDATNKLYKLGIKQPLKFTTLVKQLFAVQNSSAIFWTIKQQSFSTISVRFFDIWIRVWSLIICNSFPSILKLHSLYTNACSVHCSISINLF